MHVYWSLEDDPGPMTSTKWWVHASWVRISWEEQNGGFQLGGQHLGQILTTLLGDLV